MKKEIAWLEVMRWVYLILGILFTGWLIKKLWFG